MFNVGFKTAKIARIAYIAKSKKIAKNIENITKRHIDGILIDFDIWLEFH